MGIYTATKKYYGFSNPCRAKHDLTSGSTMSQAVNRWRLIRESRVLFGECDIETSVSSITSLFPPSASIHPPMPQIHSLSITDASQHYHLISSPNNTFKIV